RKPATGLAGTERTQFSMACSTRGGCRHHPRKRANRHGSQRIEGATMSWPTKRGDAFYVGFRAELLG
ncbi:hypothetical protein NMT96_25210, partial [Escherichia coli]|nr:hypothetical protein [Escherichia coli]